MKMVLNKYGYQIQFTVAQPQYAKTRGAPKDLSHQVVGFSTKQQGEAQLCVTS